jgi:hypothetical protein
MTSPTPTQVSLTSSSNPSDVGLGVTLTASISGDAAIGASGSIIFNDNGQQIGTGTLQGTQGSFTTSALAVGQHPITAIFTDSSSNQVTSAVFTQVIQQAGTSTTVSSSVNPALLGQPITLTAVVANPQGTALVPTGTVTFTDNGVTLGSTVLQQNGQVQLSLSTLAIGSHSIVANYSGDANFTASSSTALAQKVIYNFSGFFAPVDNLPTYNRVKAGSAIPVKFSLAGNQGLNILTAGSPSTVTMNCNSGSVDDIEQTVTASNSGLIYDVTANQYVYTWKTDKTWAGTCRQLTVTLIDGTSHVAYFTLTK